MSDDAAEGALNMLAQRLYWNLNRLDPDPDAPDWRELDTRSRRLYVLLVADLICYEDAIQIARGSMSMGAGKSSE